MKSSQALLVMIALAAAAAHAGPPPGHPSPAAAASMMQLPKNTPESELPLTGTVVSTIDANEYTYVEVKTEKGTEWLAAPKLALEKGAVIRFEDGARMSNFYSKLLKRSFPSVNFVSGVLVTK